MNHLRAQWRHRIEAAAPVRGIPFKDLWHSTSRLSVVVVTKRDNPFGTGNLTVMVDFKEIEYQPVVPFQEIIYDLSMSAERKAKTLDLIQAHGTDYVALTIDGEKGHWLAAQAPSFEGNWQWQAPRDSFEGTYSRRFEPFTTFYNTMIYGDDKALTKLWAEHVIGVPYDDRQFADIETGQTVTVYRGISLPPGADPLTTSKEERSNSKGIGSSWTASEEAAMSIAERERAGFSNENILRNDVEWLYLKKPYVPTVLRAEVVIHEQGASPYRPWGTGYVSEMEIDIPYGTDIHINGYKQAEPVPAPGQDVAKAKADYKKGLELKARDDYGPNGETFDLLNAGYYVHWRWGSYRSANVTRRAALA